MNNMGNFRNYNATLATIAKIYGALDVAPGDLLELIDEPAKAKRAAKKKKG